MAKKKGAVKKKAGAKKKKSSKKKEGFRQAIATLRSDVTRVAAILGITIGKLDDASEANGIVLDRTEHQAVLKEIADRFRA